MLYENVGEVLEQTLWGLGNVSGDSGKCRDGVIMKGGVEAVLRII